MVHSDPPAVFLAEDDDVLTRLLALDLVARTASRAVESEVGLGLIRDALLEERWADAVVAWIEHTGTVIDAYPDEIVWATDQLDPDRVALEIRIAPIFQD